MSIYLKSCANFSALSLSLKMIGSLRGCVVHFQFYDTRSKFIVIDLFGLYIFFSHFRPRDVLKGILLLFLHNLCVHAHVHKTTFERNCSLK